MINAAASHRSYCMLASACLLVMVAISAPAAAGPWQGPGDRALRADVQLLADAGVITTPVMMWPIPTAELLRAVQAERSDSTLTTAEEFALARLRNHLRKDSVVGEVEVEARIAASEAGTPYRTFSKSPRGDGELALSGEWIGSNLAAGLTVMLVANPLDDKEFRLDGSHVDAIWGNWIFSGNSLDRWWGPGWDSSIILSTNARPIPALTLQRNYADPPDLNGLRWIGPWSMSAVWGFLEDEREIPDARFFGMRVGFRPLPNLELGVSRTAQWCGQGRPCDFDTFVKLLIGDDNSGGEDDTLPVEREPGNQLAGFDLRWSAAAFGVPLAVYAQAIGEDEAGGFPSRYLGMLGFESWIQPAGGTHYWHVFLELADTACDFRKSKPIFDCGYNNSIYTDGYRYRRRAIGHAFDNDARSVSLGVDLVDSAGSNWGLLLRSVELNRAGNFDDRNTVTPTPRDLLNLELFHSRDIRNYSFEVGIGFDVLDDKVSGSTAEDARTYIQITSGFGG